MTDNEVFKRVYTYTFGFALTAPAKTLPLEVAVLGWKCLFHEQHPFHAYLGYWVEFLETEYKKAISKDTWNMLLEFATWLQGEGDKGVKEYDIYGMAFSEEGLVQLLMAIQEHGHRLLTRSSSSSTRSRVMTGWKSRTTGTTNSSENYLLYQAGKYFLGSAHESTMQYITIIRDIRC